MFERPQQKRAKAPAFRRGLAQKIPFYNESKKCLRQILRIVWRLSAPPDKSIKGIPVFFAEALQGLTTRGGVPTRGGHYHGPMGRGEPQFLFRKWLGLRLHL